mmetsp:Transcript_55902/g.81741  ORF Transcript_55902/g.81741 Transcript_55902/m.81741 type:complete len:85 (-) Transcript_55902:676-930(-)
MLSHHNCHQHLFSDEALRESSAQAVVGAGKLCCCQQAGSPLGFSLGGLSELWISAFAETWGQCAFCLLNHSPELVMQVFYFFAQ